MYSQGAKQYQSINNETGIMDADPHRLIQLLIDGALARIAKAKGCIEHGLVEDRNNTINSAIAIIGGLRDSLNMEAGEVAMTLERLYDYMEHRLFQANVNNDAAALDEVGRLLGEIKTAWDGIREEALKIKPEENK